MQQKIRIGKQQERISLVLHLPSESPSFCFIACHGMFSSKDSDKFIAIAERFTQEGIAVLRFDDRGVGKSGGKFLIQKP